MADARWRWWGLTAAIGVVVVVPFLVAEWAPSSPAPILWAFAAAVLLTVGALLVTWWALSRTSEPPELGRHEQRREPRPDPAYRRIEHRLTSYVTLGAARRDVVDAATEGFTLIHHLPHDEARSRAEEHLPHAKDQEAREAALARLHDRLQRPERNPP